jgi:hypothetical protein
MNGSFTPSAAVARDFLAALSKLATSIPWTGTGPTRPRFEIDFFGNRTTVSMAPRYLSTVATATICEDGSVTYRVTNGVEIPLDVSDMPAAARTFYNAGHRFNGHVIASLPE